MAEGLLYQLRAPTTPLDEKRVLAQAALDSLTPTTAVQLRDWTVDQFLRSSRAAKQDADAAQSQLILEEGWWTLLVRTLDVAPGVPSASILPAFVAFASKYTGLSPDGGLVASVLAVAKRAMGAALRKSTIDVTLEGLATMLQTSDTVLSRASDDVEIWQDLAEYWLKAMAPFVDAGKGNKKVLANMPSLVAILANEATSNRLRSTVTSLIQASVFSSDNFRRGLARETYNTAQKDVGDSTLSELFEAFRTLMTDDAKSAMVIPTLPTFLALYLDSLSTHASTLFPLPARSTFATPSAFRSASELHSLEKRRALAGEWIRALLKLLAWQNGDATGSRSTCLTNSLRKIEGADLYHQSTREGWSGVLPAVVQGTVAHLNGSGSSEERDGLYSVLNIVAGMSFEDVGPHLDSIFTFLASSPSSKSEPTLAFLETILQYHTRTLLIPSLLLRLSDAQASATTITNNVLTAHAWVTALESAIAKVVGVNSASTWSSLVATLQLPSSSDVLPDGSERKQKRRKVTLEEQPLAGRVRILTYFVRGVPGLEAVLPLLEEARESWIEPALKDLAKGRKKIYAREVLDLHYAIVERLRSNGIDEESWALGKKQMQALLALVAPENPDLAPMAARSLLQAMSSQLPSGVTLQILGAILDCVVPNEKTWTGNLRGLAQEELPAALWEMLTRRFLPTFEQYASHEQLARFASLAISSLSKERGIDPAPLSFEGISARLLNRADFYEMDQLQGWVETALLELVGTASLPAPGDVLAAVSSARTSGSLSAVDVTSFRSAVATIAGIARFMPIEFIRQRYALVSATFGWDLLASASHFQLDNGELEASQEILRSFVCLATESERLVPQTPAIMTYLMRRTATGSRLTSLTVDTYGRLLQSAIDSYSTDSTILEQFTAALGTLAELPKRVKTGGFELTCEELALFTYCQAMSTLLKERADQKPVEILRTSVRSALKSASKSLIKALTCLTGYLANTPSLSLDISGFITGCSALWKLHEALDVDISDSSAASYSAFAQESLGALLQAVTAPGDLTPSVRAGDACVAILDLLSFRLSSNRARSDSAKLPKEPFVTFVACHYVFRQALALDAVTLLRLDTNLAQATSSATIREYEAALLDTAALIGEIAVQDVTIIAHLSAYFSVALMLLLHAPEGSSRIAMQGLSQILRHLSLLLLASQSPSGLSVSVDTLLVVARFLEGIASERAMLLSRQDVSSLLPLVCRMIAPVEASFVSQRQTGATASELFRSLVNIVDMLVRHRKDHIAPLFPHLVATIAAFIAALRRPGYGTTGSSVGVDGVDSEIALGRRAEREARSTFATWVWEAEPSAIGRPEAKAVGRLLGSLTAKTPGTLKRKRDATDAKEEGTTSLAAPLSKHAPFILLPYVRACVDSVSPIPAALRSELQGGLFEMMEVMGKFEREALLKGFLGEGEDAERGVLRTLYKTWEKERYRG